MAENTPTISPSRIRNAARYCAVRSVMTFQPATMMRMVVKVVSRISGSAMPSTPSE